MNANQIHDIIFYIMYAALAIAVLVIIERLIYFAYTRSQAKKLAEALTPHVRSSADLPADLRDKESLPVKVVKPVLDHAGQAGSREEIEDMVDAQYMLSKAPMARGLWLLDTVVTAAPLLGLLGTIMGIIETFKALAASGVSDASQVSAGMGMALLATALGITIALVALIANNFLNSRMERINELLKVCLIRASGGSERQLYIQQDSRTRNHYA